MNVSRHGWDTFDTLIIVILNMSPPLRGGHLLTNDGMQGQGAKKDGDNDITGPGAGNPTAKSKAGAATTVD